MALETLKDIDSIDGFGIKQLHTEEDLDNWTEADFDDKPIAILHPENLLTIKIQKGPIKEAGVNGAQVDTILTIAKTIISGLDKMFPCEENKECISHLDMAYSALQKRKANREARGVEGENKI